MRYRSAEESGKVCNSRINKKIYISFNITIENQIEQVKNKMIIESIAPTRIDLAGGTLDIWPLYVFFNKPLTINAAIDLYSKVTVRSRKDKKIEVISKDRKKRIMFDSISQIHHKHPLSLITRIIEFYAPKKGFTMITECLAPAYSGLGGSSSLNIAINGALNQFCKNNYSKEQILEIAKNIEAFEISTPTGIQDYIAALYGGINIIHLRKKGMKIIKNTTMIKELEESILLCNSGKPHHSGMNNWKIYKSIIEGKKNVIHNMKKISITSERMNSAIKEKDLKKISILINEEWKNRKLLSKCVSSRKIEKLIKTGMKNGATAAKICGAGGGGCLIFITGSDKDKISNSLKPISNIIDFKIAKKGLVVKVK